MESTWGPLQGRQRMSQLTKWTTISQEGIDLIKRFEGFSSEVYYCAGNFPTVAFGHKLLPGEKFTSVTREQGEQILKKDLNETIKQLNYLITTELTLNQFSALASFIFNLGYRAFNTSTLKAVVNAGEHLDVPAELIKWRLAAGQPLKGLLLRRLAEASLYLS